MGRSASEDKYKSHGGWCWFLLLLLCNLLKVSYEWFTNQGNKVNEEKIERRKKQRNYMNLKEASWSVEPQEELYSTTSTRAKLMCILYAATIALQYPGSASAKEPKQWEVWLKIYLIHLFVFLIQKASRSLYHLQSNWWQWESFG